MTRAIETGAKVMDLRGDAAIYGGVDATAPTGWESRSYRMGSGDLPTLTTSADRVAPYEAVSDHFEQHKKDARVRIEKLSNGRGQPWQLQIEGLAGTTWYKTKRAAVEEGTARLAIADWHKAVTA